MVVLVLLITGQVLTGLSLIWYAFFVRPVGKTQGKASPKFQFRWGIGFGVILLGGGLWLIGLTMNLV